MKLFNEFSDFVVTVAKPALALDLAKIANILLTNDVARRLWAWENNFRSDLVTKIHSALLTCYYGMVS